MPASEPKRVPFDPFPEPRDLPVLTIAGQLKPPSNKWIAHAASADGRRAAWGMGVSKAAAAISALKYLGELTTMLEHPSDYPSIPVLDANGKVLERLSPLELGGAVN